MNWDKLLNIIGYIVLLLIVICSVLMAGQIRTEEIKCKDDTLMIQIEKKCQQSDRIEDKLDLLLKKEQPRDRSDKEKAIKDCLQEPTDKVK